jgi:hypothetical protein
MERFGEDIYCQTYYSENFFTLMDVQDDEVIRLMRMSVEVIYYEISLLEEEGTLYFFLHLYFRPNPIRPLSYKELFGNINL